MRWRAYASAATASASTPRSTPPRKRIGWCSRRACRFATPTGGWRRNTVRPARRRLNGWPLSAHHRSRTFLACDRRVLVARGAAADEGEPGEEVLLPADVGGIAGVDARLECLQKVVRILE